MPKDDVMAGVFTENPDETGWLLENGEVAPKYIGVIDGALRWTDDSLKALRLARREDGNALAEIVDDCWRIVEHKWCYPSGPSQPSEGTRATLCGEVVQHLIAGASWFTCALPKDHKEKGHRAAGNCIKHGPYIGEPHAVPQCPRWPDCITGAVLTGVAPSDTGREQPPDAQKWCESQGLVLDGYLLMQKVGEKFGGMFALMNSFRAVAPGVAPAQAQPDIEALAREIDDFYFVGTPEEKRLSAIRAILSRRASDPQKGQGWVSVASSGLPKVGKWCWIVCNGIVQRMAANLQGRGFDCADGYEWAWADDEADPAPLEVVTHYQYMAAPPSVPAGPQEEKK